MPFWKALQGRALIGRESADLHGAGDHCRGFCVEAVPLAACDTSREGWDAGNLYRGRPGAIGACGDGGRLVHGLKGSRGVVGGLEGDCSHPNAVPATIRKK